MRSRTTALVLIGSAIVLTALASLDVAVYPCPVQHLVDQPCPGCGMTRGVAALLSGHVVDAVRLHAFSPLALLALTGLAVAAVLPADPRDRLARTVASIERRTLFPALLTAAIFAYWIGRIALQIGPDHAHVP